MAKKVPITKVLSCFFVLVILMSSFSVAVIASDSSNSTASNVTDNANTSSPDPINESVEVLDPNLPVLNDTDISTAKTVSSLGYCSYVWIEITDKYCKGYEVYVDGVYQFTEGESGTPDGCCGFKVTPGYHTFKLTLNGKEVSKGWNCQCGVAYNWMSMNNMIPHWCEGGSGNCDNPPTVNFDKTTYYEGDTVHITVSTIHSSVYYKIKDCSGTVRKSGYVSNGESIYYTISSGASECCYWQICFYWDEYIPPIALAGAGGEVTAQSYDCTKCYSFYVCPHETPCKVWIEVVDKYCKGYKVYVDGVYQFTEGESGTPDGYCKFYVTPGTHKFELRKNGCSVSKSWYCQCGTYYSWVSMNDMYPHWCECNKPTPPPVKEVKFRGTVMDIRGTTPWVQVDEVISGSEYISVGDYTDIACYTTAGETGPCGHCDIVKKGDKVEVYGKRLPIYQIPMVISICGKTSYYMRKIGKPDLVIEDISWSPSNPKQGDTITFTVKIKNRGDGNAGTSTVKYYIDGSYVDSDTVPSLSVGSTSTQMFTWTAHSGSHSIKAIADCYGAIAESNEGNNEKSITIEVGEEPEEIKFIGTFTGQNWPMGFGAYYFKVDKMLEGPIPVGDDIRVMVYMSAYPNPLNNYDRLKKGDKAEVYAEFEEELGKRYDSWVDREVWAADITGDETYYVKNIEEKREIILPVPYYDQDRTNWCELATLSMVLKYYGYSLHPEALAEIFGVDHDNFLNFWNIERILLFLQESRKIPESLGLKTKGIAFEKEEIKNSVDKGYPIFLGMPFPINHAVVIVGYEEGNNPGDPILFINDPSGHFTNTICGNKKDPEIVVPIKFSNVKKNLPWLSQVFSVQGEPTPPSGTIYLYDGAIFVGKPKPGAPKGITTPVCHLWLDRGISWKYQNGEIKHNLKLENSNVFNIGCTICNHKKTDSNYDLFLYIRDASGKIVYEDVNTYPKEPILVKGERTQIVKFPIFDLNKFPAGSYELGISLFKIIGPGHEEFCDSIGTIPFTIEESAKPLEKIWITGPDEIKAGETLQWQAYGSYSDGTQKELTNQVSWTADPSDILQNMDNGKFKGLKGGEATLKIDYEGKSASKKVTVIEKENHPPKASFTYEKDGLTVRFTSTGYDPDGDIETYSWFFGDGDTSNQKNPTHRYSSEGTYTVVLLVRDDKGLPGSCSEDITITEKPKEKPDLIIQDISWEPKNPETGDPVDFTITIKNIGTKDVNKPIYVDFKFCGNYFPRKKIEGLKAGESANVIYKGIGAGTCEAIATVDPYNAIPESDETNNIMIKTLVTKEVLKEYMEYLSKSSNFYKTYSEKNLVPSYWHGEAKQHSTEVTNKILINIDISLATRIVTIIAPATSTVIAPFSILSLPFTAANVITSEMMEQDCDGVSDALSKSDFFTLRDKMSLLEFNADLLDSELKKGSPNLEMTLQIRRQEILDAYEQLCSFDQEFASNVDNTGHLSDKASKYNLAHLYIAGLATKLREDYAVTTAVLNAYTDTDSDAEIPDFEKYELKSHCFERAGADLFCFGYLKDKKEVDEYAITIDPGALVKKVDVNRPSGYHGFEDYLKTSYTLYDAGGKKIGEGNSNTGLHCNVKVYGTYYLDVQSDAGAGGYVVIIDTFNLVKGGVQIVPHFQ